MAAIAGLLVSLLLTAMPLKAASGFADPGFQQQWQTGEAITPNFWGPLALAKDGQQESYKEAAGGKRLVQYFDKGRMELTNGSVTNGLLATEIVKGQIQTGDATFQPGVPPTIPVAGDPDNVGPTYATLATKGKPLFDAAPQQTGNYAQAVLSPTGDISVSNAGPSDPVTFAAFDNSTKHNVPKAFADYRAKAGLQTIGYGISEPFTTTVKVGGQQRQVVVQVFERRVLTYTASNDAAFRVEMGNIGTHYYLWRYGSSALPPTSSPVPTAVSPSPVMTQVPAPPVSNRLPQRKVVGSLAVTLYAIRDPAVSTNSLDKPHAGNRYVALDVTIENVGSGSQDYNKFEATVKTTDDRKFQIGFGARGGEPDLGSGTNQPGEKSRGWVTFEIPSGAVLASFTYSDFGGDAVTFMFT